MRSTVGISALQAGEDVQCPPFRQTYANLLMSEQICR